MGAIFELKQIQVARYGRETVPYTWGPATLLSGATPIFDISDWNPGDETDKIVVLDSIAATQNANVQLLVSYDGQQWDPAQGWTDAMPKGLVPIAVNAWAARRLALSVNNTGAAIPNFQLNYTVTVWKLPISYEQMLGYAPSQADMDLLASLPADANGTTAAAQLTALLQKGTQPISWVRTLDALFYNRRLPDLGVAVPRHVTTASALFPSSFNMRVPPGQVGVLEGIGFEGQPASVVLSIDRDSDIGYVQVNAAAIARSDDMPLGAWVPATDHFTFNVSGAVGTFTMYPIVRAYKLSDLLAIHLGIQKTPATSYAKVGVGLQ
jgi:hypothetical protein